MWVVKEFREILARGEKRVFIHFPREEKGPDAWSGIGTEGWDFESFIGLQRTRCMKRGCVHVYPGPQQYLGWLCLYRMWFFG